MRVVIPVSYHDQSALPDFITILLKFGGLARHHITFVPQLSQTQAAKVACARVLPFAANATVLAMDHDLPLNNMPQSPNAQFAFAARNVAAMPEQLMWLWMELDAFPRKENWLDELESAVIRAGTPFYGNIVPTPFRTEQGAWVTQPQDMMMMGVGVYHPQTANMMGLVNDLRIGPTGAPWAWGVYLRQTMMGIGWTDTKLISDMNGTCNYRMEGDTLVCDTAPSDPPRRPRFGPVNPEAVLIHGCKDGSLARLLLGEIAMDDHSVHLSKHLQMETETGTVGPVGEAGEVGPDDSSLAGPPNDDWVGTKPGDLGIEDVGVGTEPGEPGPSGTPDEEIIAWLKAQLKAGGLRLKSFNDQWNMGNEMSKFWLSENGFTVVGPGWIKKAKKK